MERLLTAEQVSVWLGISPAQVKRLASRRELPVCKIGAHCWRFRPADVRNYITPPSVEEIQHHTEPNNLDCVYFVQAVNGGPVKIGIASNLKKRLKALQMQSPYSLRVLYTIKTDKARTIEADLHRRFAPCRLHGEWFTPSPELLRFIESHEEGTN